MNLLNIYLSIKSYKIKQSAIFHPNEQERTKFYLNCTIKYENELTKLLSFKWLEWKSTN